MTLIFEIALGIVLGAILLAYLDKVMYLALAGIAACIAVVILVVGYEYLIKLSTSDVYSFLSSTFYLVIFFGGICLLIFLLIFPVIQVLALLDYFHRVAQAKSLVIARRAETSTPIGKMTTRSPELQEAMLSPYATYPFALQRQTSVGWVTIDGSYEEKQLRGRLGIGVVPHYLFKNKHRIISHQFGEAINVI